MSDLSQSHDLNGIAVIGLAGRFPGAGDISTFWQNLRKGVESITFFTDDELLAAGADPTVLTDPKYVKARGVLPDAEWFDASFFGYAPREAELMDPQHRVFLECAWQALEDAGYDAQSSDVLVGVFAGMSLSSYMLRNISPVLLRTLSGMEFGLSNDKDFLATRVSYKLNLRGPSVVVQSACSTSLVAISQACQSLLSHQCDMALAGGATVGVPIRAGSFYQEGGVVSPDGHCRAFDARAQGFVAGSGVGIVVLKRLEDALKDRDTIHAVVRGSAVNNDGFHKVGFTAPSVDGQAEVILMAQALAEVSAETISNIEAHGTGTPLGDPIEIAALTRAFRTTTDKKGFCAIGSVKTNVGHLDAAAGVTGFIKTVLALEHGELPPSLHFTEPNPKIDFANSPFYVNTRLLTWRRGTTPRRAGVSSFGIGGTNAHVVLEEAPPQRESGPSRSQQLLVLSARTRAALDRATSNLVTTLKENPGLNLADVAYTLKVGRKRFNHRRFVVCSDPHDAVGAFESLDPRQVCTDEQDASDRPVAFLFPGQGTQHPNMGLELYQSERTFRELVDRSCELLAPQLGCDLRNTLFPGDEAAGAASDRLKQTAFAQVSLFVIEHALAGLWAQWGLRPQAMIGHSIGEYVAACLSGVLSLEDALTLVAERGRLMQSLPPGSMLAVPLSAVEVEGILEEGLSLAAINEPDLCVVSGPAEMVDRLEAGLTQRNVICRRLHTSHAFHSAMMEPILDRFRQIVGRATLHPPRIPFISDLTGTWITAEQATDADYWTAHLRSTVRFADGIQELLKEPNRVLLEVGPGNALSTLAERCPDRRPEQAVVSSMRHPRDPQSDLGFLLRAVGKIWSLGVRLDWQSFYTHECRRRIPLPTYPFERQRYWIERSGSSQRPDAASAGLEKLKDIADWFYVPSWKRSTSPLALGQTRPHPRPARWLVFADSCGLLADELVKRLEGQGQVVSVVHAGAEFARTADHKYVLKPGEQEHYRSLLAALKETGRTPNLIAHLWAIGTDGSSESHSPSDALLDRCFYSPLWLVQAMGRAGISDSIQLTMVSSDVHDVTGDEVHCPEKATLLGPCRVIPQEYPNISCRSVDVALSDLSTSSGASIIDQLLAELLTQPVDPVVAYRCGHRWTQIHEPVRMEAGEGTPLRVRKGGVYLITGGLGGIGLALAEYLARTASANLILLSRKGLPPRPEWQRWLASHPDSDPASRKIRAVEALERLGAQVLIEGADVADHEQMHAVIARARGRFGAIHGVIHSAGIAGGGLIPLKSTEKAAAVLAPKVRGARVLGELFEDAGLDFMVLCSSLAAILGNAGQVDYTAANAFLDAFAHQRKGRAGGLTVSINWDAWSETGMAVETEVPPDLMEQRRQDLKKGIRGEEGVEVFQRILSSSLSQIAVSTRDLRRRIELQERGPRAVQPMAPAEAPPSRAAHSRPVLKTAYEAPRNEVEERIAKIWQELLGIDQVGIYDNFFDLGGHSLLALQLTSRLNAELQAEISVDIFFDAPTVAGVADRTFEINQQKRDQQAKAARMVEMVEQLSEDEVNRLLAESDSGLREPRA